MTKQEYLDWWNKNNPGQYATIKQVEKCGCKNVSKHYKNLKCQGYYIAKIEKKKFNK